MSSALPKSIRDQIKNAEDIHGKVYTKGDKPPADDPKNVDGGTPPADDKPEGDAPKGGQPPLTAEPAGGEPAGGEPAGGEPAGGEPTGDGLEGRGDDGQGGEPPAPSSDDDAWKKRYNILKGKYDAEVPRMAAEIRDLKAESKGLRTLIETLQSRQHETPSAPAAPAGTGEQYIKPEEIEAYGEDLVSVIRRGAQEVVSPEMKKLQDEVTQLKSQLGSVNQSLVGSAREQLLSVLDRDVPNWREVNDDMLFIDWLQHTDPYSGATRQDMLQQAYERNDTARVKAFFKGYLDENDALQPNTGGQAPTRNTTAKLEDMVAPGKPSGKAPGTAPKGDKRTWTQAQITAFYHKVNTGKFKNKPKEQAEIERDIIAAASEGRITA